MIYSLEALIMYHLQSTLLYRSPPLPSYNSMSNMYYHVVDPVVAWPQCTVTHLRCLWYGCSTQWLTWGVHNGTPGLSNDGSSSSHVPAVDAHVVVGISRSARHQAHVDCRTARRADATGATFACLPHTYLNHCQISSRVAQWVEHGTCTTVSRVG